VGVKKYIHNHHIAKMLSYDNDNNNLDDNMVCIYELGDPHTHEVIAKIDCIFTDVCNRYDNLYPTHTDDNDELYQNFSLFCMTEPMLPLIGTIMKYSNMTQTMNQRLYLIKLHYQLMTYINCDYIDSKMLYDFSQVYFRLNRDWVVKFNNIIKTPHFTELLLSTYRMLVSPYYGPTDIDIMNVKFIEVLIPSII